MMMVEEINKSVKQNRNWAFLGAGIGLLLIVCYFGYEFMMSVDRPTIRDSRPEVIVSYIINPRGLEKLTQIEQRQFLEEWRNYLMSDEDAKEALASHLKDLDSSQRKQFVNEMMEQFKNIVVDDARQFDRMPTAERNVFIRKRAEELMGQEKFTTEIAKIFGSEVGGQDQIRQWIFGHTTPAEREICSPYLQAIQDVAEQIKKQQRRSASVVAKP